MDSLFPEFNPRPNRPTQTGTTLSAAVESLAVRQFHNGTGPGRRIEVQRRDIDGADTSFGNNPTARAIRRECRLEADCIVWVWRGHVQISQTVYLLPIEVDRAESMFGKVGEMEPFTFHFDDQTQTDTV